jgi:hippurate hydrolase
VTKEIEPNLEALYPSLDALYRDLHQHPELSLQEEETAKKMAARLRALGFEVTERVGGFGVVGVLRNGDGPTLLVRTDIDALPVKEQTGLPYASMVTAKNESGVLVPVMHACGHDLHMTAWVGTATLLAKDRARWRGTLLFVGQPAEEMLSGANAMIRDGLFTRFPRPDFAIAIHDTNRLPAGQVGLTPGFAMAATDAVDITIFGKGGHGAYPHLTIDPIAIAARTVVALQSIVSREVNPLDSAVITVGSIHGGTKHNIIPDRVQLQLTVRSFKPEVQKQLLAAIERIVRHESAAGRAPKEPVVSVDPNQSGAALYNDPVLVGRLGSALVGALGQENVTEIEPVTGSEDFGAFGRAAGAPSVLIRVGAAEPAAFAAATASGEALPGIHSPLFAPERERTIRTGVSTLTACAFNLLGTA